MKIVYFHFQKRTVVNKTCKSTGLSKFAAFRAEKKLHTDADKYAHVSTIKEKVFDAGFFKLNSPVRPPQYHCEGQCCQVLSVSSCVMLNVSKNIDPTVDRRHSSLNCLCHVLGHSRVVPVLYLQTLYLIVEPVDVCWVVCC